MGTEITESVTNFIHSDGRAAKVSITFTVSIANGLKIGLL